MTITASSGCNIGPSSQAMIGNSKCNFSMTWNSPGCTATFTNESIITTCDASSNCAFGPINNMVVTVLCNGSSWTLTDNSGGTTVTETGSCTCEKVVSTTVATPVLVPVCTRL